MKRMTNYNFKQTAFALAAALCAMGPTVAKALPVCSAPITTAISGPVYWSSGDCTIASGGSISGNTGISASGTLGTLYNSGLIYGSIDAVVNGGTITALNNAGDIASVFSGIGIQNNGSIGTLTNSGSLSGAYEDIANSGSIGVLTNNGTISSGPYSDFGIYNTGGTIGTLTNNGTISSSIYLAIANSGTIATFVNNGTIDGGQIGIYNVGGTIGTLINTGLITGASVAIHNGTSLGPIINSGIIAGNIDNTTNADLSISGGTGTIFGTLTGYGGSNAPGTINNTVSNVTFGSGNLLLNDNINVGSNAVNNRGAVLQVNQPLTITGDYNQTGGALQIGAVTSTQSGELVVTGNSTMTGGAVVIVPAGYALAAGQRYLVVDTAGTANYGSGLTYSAGTLSATGSHVLSAGHDDLIVALSAPASPPTPTPPPTTAPPTTAPPTTPTPPTPSPSAIVTAPDAAAALGGLSRYPVSGTNAALLNLFNAAVALSSGGTTAAVNRAGAQLSPVSQAGQAAAAPTLDALNLVGAHSDSLRLAQAGGESGVSTGEGPPPWGVWGQAYGGHTSQSERDHVDGYRANYGGLLLGVDRAINERWRAGGVLTYSNTAVDNTGNTAGDTTRVNGYGLIGYASYSGNPWYVNLSGGVVQQQYDTTRAVNFPGFSGTATGSFSGQQYVARAEFGFPLALGNCTLTPLASLTYGYLNQGGYTESGGNGAALSVDSSHASSVKSSLGARLSRSFPTRYGEIVPALQAQWIHQYKRTGQVTSADFAGDPTGQTAFTTVGTTPLADLADISLGATLLRANNLSLAVRYEIQAAPGLISQTGTLRLRQLF